MKKIAIIGGGKIGSTFAFQLARAGHEITIVARPGSLRLAQLQRDNGIVLTTGETVATHVTDTLDEAVPYNLLIVTMYDFQVEAILPALQRSHAQAVQFMFVTFDPERLQTAVGAERCTFGMPAVMARLGSDGKLSPKINPRQKTLHGSQRWVDLFIAAGIPSTFEVNMPLWLRCHVPLTVAMESVSAAACQRGKAASWSRAKEVARGMRAGYVLIEAQGHPVYPGSKRFVAALPMFAMATLLRALSSIKSFRELLANGAKEARALVDAMVATAVTLMPSRPCAIEAIRAMSPADGPTKG